MQPGAGSLPFAARLRKRQTRAEAILWHRLRNHRLVGVGFRRQHAIGKFVVDFCAPGKRLIIEVDGHHPQQAEYDAARTKFLESKGYRVIRFFNSEVLRDIDLVLYVILQSLEEMVHRHAYWRGRHFAQIFLLSYDLTGPFICHPFPALPVGSACKQTCPTPI